MQKIPLFKFKDLHEIPTLTYIFQLIPKQFIKYKICENLDQINYLYYIRCDYFDRDFLHAAHIVKQEVIIREANEI